MKWSITKTFFTQKKIKLVFLLDFYPGVVLSDVNFQSCHQTRYCVLSGLLLVRIELQRCWSIETSLIVTFRKLTEFLCDFRPKNSYSRIRTHINRFWDKKKTSWVFPFSALSSIFFFLLAIYFWFYFSWYIADIMQL